MSIKLIVVDLDGTILQNQYNIHPYNIEIIKKLTKDYLVVIATGRPWRASSKFYQQLELNTPIINYNGAFIHHPGNNNFKRYLLQIPRNVVCQIEKDLKRYLHNVMCEYEENVYLNKPCPVLNDFFWHDSNPLYYGSMEEILKIDPCTFVIEVKKEKDKEKVFEYLKQYPDLCLRFWGDDYSLFGEITKKGISKYSAINYLMSQYEINKEEIFVIGDAGNDYEMIKEAAVGVAMINGENHIKAIADFITELPCESGGAGKFLAKYFNII